MIYIIKHSKHYWISFICLIFIFFFSSCHDSSENNLDINEKDKIGRRKKLDRDNVEYNKDLVSIHFFTVSLLENLILSGFSKNDSIVDSKNIKSLKENIKTFTKLTKSTRIKKINVSFMEHDTVRILIRENAFTNLKKENDLYPNFFDGTNNTIEFETEESNGKIIRKTSINNSNRKQKNRYSKISSVSKFSDKYSLEIVTLVSEK